MHAKTLALSLCFVAIGLSSVSCRSSFKDERDMASASKFIDQASADATATTDTMSTSIDISLPIDPVATSIPVSEESPKAPSETPKAQSTPPPASTTPTPTPAKEPVPPLMRNYQERFIPARTGIGFKYDLKCAADELISGVRFNDFGDDHVVGIYCGKFDGSSSLLREQLVPTDHRAGNLIPIDCPSNGYLGGLFMDNFVDKGEDGLYCRQTPGGYQFALQNLKPVRNGDGNLYDAFCELGSFVTGVLYQDPFDDSIHSLQCSKLSLAK